MLNKTNYKHVILNRKSVEVEKGAITHLVTAPFRPKLTLERTQPKLLYSGSAF